MTIGSDIINTLGGGSGINSGNLVEQLSEIEKAPKQQIIDSKREKFEAQVSDYGLLRSALALLQDSADILADPASFNSKNATFTDSTSLIPVSIEDDTPLGDYTFEVLEIAQAQSLSSAAVFASSSDTVGKGVMNFSFGGWDGGLTTFTENTEKAGFSITIDDSNNSLKGLRDAINAADKGVQASIINDGSGEKLVIKAPSGAKQQLEINVVEDGAAPGLAAFAFEAGNQLMNQNQDGHDASLKVNGLLVSRSSNSIDDVVDGFKFDLAKKAPGEIMTVSIVEDKASAELSIRDFVESYNTFLEVMEPLVDFNEETDEFGSLHRDATSTALMRNLRSVIVSEVPEVQSAFNFIGTIGVRTELDGTMTIDEETFTKAFNEDFSAIKELFAPATSSSSDKITVNGFGTQTVPGSYEVVILQDPEKGKVTGAAAEGTLLADLDAPLAGYLTGGASDVDLVANIFASAPASGDYDFQISVDGTLSNNIQLTTGVDYTDVATLAAHIQAQINADTNLTGAGSSVTVSHDGLGFVVKSDSTGAASAVTGFTGAGVNVAELGLGAGVETAGSDDAPVGAYDFTINVNGVSSGNISIDPGSYADHDALAAHIKAQINADTALQAGGSSVNVSWDTDHFVIESSRYGAVSAVSVTAVGANAADLGLAAGTSSSGKDVSGTVGGKNGFGVGNVLLPELNSDPYGLSFIVQEGATDSTVNFSRGFGSTLSQLIEGYLKTSGVIASRVSGENGLNEKIKDLDNDQSELERRMTAYTDRLMAQFQNMERIVASLNSSGGFLDGILDRLPFTAQN